MAEFRMPSLGADMTEGTLVEWLVQPGDEVQRGDIVAVVDTEKAAIEVEVFDSGVIDRLLVEPGAHAPVGTPLAVVRPAGAPPPAPAPVVVASPAPRSAPAAAPVPGSSRAPETTLTPAVTSPLVRRLAVERGVDLTGVSGSGPGGRIVRADVEWAHRPVGGPAGRRRSSPFARSTAQRLGLDLAAVTGTGPGGAIGVADVERAAALQRRAESTDREGPAAGRPPERPERPARSEGDQAASMQRAIADLMARSSREIPHYYLATTIDFSAARRWLDHENAERPVTRRLLPAALLLKAVALAAREHAQLNGHWVDGGFRAGDGVHLGVAIALRGGGLVAPALRDADGLALDELMERLRDLIARARSGRLRGSEMTDPTITVTNLGEQGAEAVHGVIYPPQVALVGFGRIVERPWAEHGMVGVRPVVVATLAGDHRASNGHTGGLLLATIDRNLQRPEEL